jgi:hypothetical protein
MTRLRAFIRPRLLLAEGLVLMPLNQPLAAAAARLAAWERHWISRLERAGLAAAVTPVQEPGSPTP